MSLGSHFRTFFRDERGTSAIETALAAPILVALALGSFDASGMVARQTELQSAVAEAAAIVQAKPPTNAAERTAIHDILVASAKVTTGDVVVSEVYRCGTSNAYVTNNACAAGTALSTFVKMTVSATYTPTWTGFGIGSPLSYNVVRTMQIS